MGKSVLRGRKTADSSRDKAALRNDKLDKMGTVTAQ